MDGTAQPSELDYLIGGLRISLSPASTTPGPRSHVLGVLDGLHGHGVRTRLFLASAQPLLGRFAGMPEGSGAGGRVQRVVSDVVRVLACLWSMLRVRLWSRGSTADVVYERAAVLQCLGIAHTRRSSALYVVESNGIFSRETAQDRQALASTRLAAALERLVYRQADLLVVVSGQLQQEVCAFAGVPDSKVLVVPNAVPDAAFTMPRPLRPATATVGFAGSLVPWQRVDLLLRAVAQVPEVRVEVIGDGPQLEGLRKMATELGLNGRAEFLGRLEHDVALQRMAGWTAGYAGHVASSSASMYHSPLKVYEYAGLGLDLVSTRTSDSEQLARDGVRVHYIEGDEASVASAVQGHAGDPRPDDEEIADVRRRLRERHSWSARVRPLLDRLALERQASQRPARGAV